MADGYSREQRMKKQSAMDRGIETRKNIMEFIIKYIEEHGYAPTVREIGEGVGLKSTSSVQAQIERLMDEGKLETDAKNLSPRTIRVPGYKFVKVD